MKHLELFRAMIAFFAHREECKELADDPSEKQKAKGVLDEWLGGETTCSTLQGVSTMGDPVRREWKIKVAA